MLPRLRRTPVITFLCRPEDYEAIPEPKRAIRATPATPGGCSSPLLGATATGWILPLAVSVRLAIKDGGRTIGAVPPADRSIVSRQGAQTNADSPQGSRTPYLFYNHWRIVTPPGWSCLFLPALYPPGQPFECVAGIVDTDSYAGHIHLPFFATAPDGEYTIERGTPLVRIVPFRRADAALDSEVRAEPAGAVPDRGRSAGDLFAAAGCWQ